ncbi:MAG TPA: YcxB family protein [Devosiaceae bacterium]|jgi:hypothetical protein
MDRIEFSFDPDYRALLDTSIASQRRRYPAALRWRVSAASIGFMLAGGAVAGFGGVMLSHLVPGLNFLVPMAVLFAIVVFVYQKLVRPWALRASALGITARRPPKPLTFAADADGLRWTDADTDFHLRWSAVERVFATAENLAFMTGALVFVVPLASLGSPQGQRDFLDLVLGRIPASAATLSRADKSLAALLP